MLNLTNYLEIAKQAAMAAGELLLAKRAEGIEVVKEQARDIKLKADRLAEKIIIDQLQQHSDFAILAEESGWNDGEDNQYFWAVDPLDGSFNYQRGIPMCCVSIALVKDNEPVLGVIYDFNRQELFSGIVGEGAYLNDVPIKVSRIDNKLQAVLNTGFPTKFEYSDVAISALIEQLKPWKKVRMLGSASLAVVYVACGRSDAYHEDGTMFWDVAAGLAIVKAAGGVIKIENKSTKWQHNIYASNGKLF